MSDTSHDLAQDRQEQYERGVLGATDGGFLAWFELEHGEYLEIKSPRFELCKDVFWRDYIEVLEATIASGILKQADQGRNKIWKHHS